MGEMNKLKNLTVDEFTTPSPLFVKTTQTLLDVKNLLKENGIRHMPIFSESEQRVVGILSDRDVRLIETCFDNIENLQVDAVMTPEPYVVEPQTPLADVVFHMSREKIGSAIVQSDNKSDDYIGIFTSTDALNALLEVLRGDIQ